ncbi:MAG: PKD domain-containing protein [Arcticibacter sp.]
MLISFSVGAQVATIGETDPGPYAPGSDITVPIELNQSLKKGSAFKLFLSDEHGQFNTNSPIGTFDSHFTTYINGTIPSGLPPGTSYKLRVGVTTPDGQYYVDYAKAIRIVSGTAPQIRIGPTDNNRILLPDKMWGFCSGVKDGNEFVIKNTSSPNAVVSAVLMNDYQQSEGKVSFDFYGSSLYTLKLRVGYYTVSFKARYQDVVSTKSYVILNSPSKISLQSDGSQIACIPDPASSPEGTERIRYSVNMAAPSPENPGSMLANYPGLTYQFDWGDGIIDYITQGELKTSGGVVQHRYTESSCGRPAIDLKVPVYNAYQANIFVVAPFCTGANTPITTYPKVFRSPVASFDIPGQRGCVNEITTFTNQSIPGQSESSDGTTCTNYTSYLWYVKEKSEPESAWKVYSDDLHFTHRFQRVGTYSIKLVASNNSCPPSEKVLDVCIEADPVLNFDYTQTAACLVPGSGPVTLTTANTTKLNGDCGVAWLWKVVDAETRAEVKDGISFIDPQNGFQPRISVSTPGNYILILESTNACKTLTFEKPFVVAGPLTVNLPDLNPKYCKDFPFTLDFEKDINLRPVYTGFAKNKIYKWEISGGNYQFLDNSQANAYPVVKFESPGIYEVSVTYDSECGRPVNDKLILTFYGPITKDAGPDDYVCDNVPGKERTTYQLHANTPEHQESGKWTVVDGPSDAFISDDKGPNAIVAGLIPGTYHLRWTVSNDAGCAEYDEMTLTVYPKPVAGKLSGNQSVCKGTGGTLKLSDFSGAIVSWESSVDQINWTTISNVADVYQFPPIQQTTFFRVNVASEGRISGCQTVVRSEPFEVKADPQTVGGKTSGEAIYCVVSAAGSIRLDDHTGNVLRWESSTDDGANWVPISYTGTNLSYNKLTVSTLFRAVVRSGECSEEYSSVTRIEVIPSPTQPDAGPDRNICAGTSSFTLQANKPTVGTGTWTQIKGSPVVFDDEKRSDATISGLQDGQHYEFAWQITNGICGSTPSNVSIHVLSPILNTIKSDRSVSCKNEEVRLTTQTLSGGDSEAIPARYTFKWEQQEEGSTTWQPVKGASGEAISVSPQITTKYRRQVSSYGQCETSSQIIGVIINPGAPESNAGESQVLCNQSSYQLNGNDPGSFVGTWKDVNPDSKLVFTPDSHNYRATVSNLSPENSYTLEWVISGLEPCRDESSRMTIQVRKPVTQAVAGADQKVCIGKDNSNNFTVLAGNLPDATNGESGFWRLVSGPAPIQFSDVSSPTTRIGNLVEGIYTLEWKLKTDARSNDLTCLESSDQVLVSVIAYPTVGRIGSPDIAICKGEAPSEMSLGPYSPKDDLQWQISTDGSTFVDIPGATGFKYAPPALDKTSSFRVKISQASDCGFSVHSNQVKVQVDAQSVGGELSLSKSKICIGEPINLKVSGHVGDVLRWEQSLDDGTWTLLAGLNGPSVTYLPQQSARFRAVVRNGACVEVLSTEAAVKVLPNVTPANAGSDQYHCNTAEFLLEGNMPQEGTGSWKQISGPVCHIGDPLRFNTKVAGASPGVYVFRWSISNNVCDPSESDVTIYNYPAIENKISGTTTICSGQTLTIFGEAPKGGNTIYRYQWEISEDEQNWAPVVNASQRDLRYLFIRSGYVRRTVSSGPCSSISNSIYVTVQPPIANNFLSEEQVLCFGEAASVISGSYPTGGDNHYTYKWQSSGDGQTWLDLDNATDKDYTPGILSKTTWFRRLVATALCNGEQMNISAGVRIVINPLSKAEFSAPVYQSCAPFELKNVIRLTPYEDRNADYEWFADGISIGKGMTFPGYTIEEDGGKVVIKLVTKSRFGCKEDTKELEFRTTKNIVARFTKDKMKGCGPLGVTFTNTSTPSGGGDFLWDFGNGKTSTEVQPGRIVFEAHPNHRDTTYVISLKVSSGCLTTEYRDSVIVRPAPRAAFSPDIVVGCSPLTVNFSNQSAGGPARYSFDFGDGSKKEMNDKEPVSHTFYSTKTDTITIKLFVQNECAIDSSTHNIVVYPNTVTPELVVDGNRKFGCAPFTVRFKNNSVGANLFHWDFKDGSTQTTSSAPAFVEHTFTQPGVYEVSMLATNGCSSGLTSEVVTVYGAPTSHFTFENKTYCKNDPVRFSVEPGPSTTYSWDFGDGTFSNEVTPKHVFPHAGVYTVRLTAFQTHPDGSVCSNVFTRQVEILALPVANFTSNSSALNCAPFTIKVSTTPSDATSVRWDFGDGSSPYNIASGYNAEHTYTKPGIFKITELAFNANGCVDSVARTIKVLERPVSGFTASDSLICGTSGLIRFTSKSASQIKNSLTYKWLVNGKQVSTQENLAHTFTVPAGASLPYTSKVQLITFNISGCSDTSSLNIKNNPLPVAAFELKSDRGCAPFTLDIKNTSLFADSYSWYLDGQLVSREKTPARVIARLQDTTYSLMLIVSNKYGCKVDSIQKTVNTYPKPQAYFTIGDSLSCYGKLEVQIRNLSKRAISYEWNFGDGSPVSTSEAPSHIYGKPGTYQLRLTAYDGQCTDVMTRTIRIAAVPQAAFASDVQRGCSQITVTFENRSLHATCFLWEFGDGTSSTEANPKHRYTFSQASYNVKLTAYGEFGCNNTSVRTQYITVSPPPVARFDVIPGEVVKVPDFTFEFKNTSDGDIKQYDWTFGDGAKSSEASPSHTYREPGEYQVTLKVTTEAGCSDVLNKTVRIEGVPGYLYVPSGFEPASMIVDLKTFLPKGSGIATYSLQIFNKWSELIWQTDKLDDRGSPMEGWDGYAGGSPAPQGVYIWKVQAKFIDGSEWKGMKYDKGSRRTVGYINLVR